MSIEDFKGKIEWEGGIEEAITGYGLTSNGYDLPDDMKRDWDALVEQGKAFAVAADAFANKYEVGE